MKNVINAIVTVGGIQRRENHGDLEQLLHNDHPMYLEANTSIYNGFGVAVASDFICRERDSGYYIPILSIASQDATSITFNLQRTAIGLVDIIKHDDNGVKWIKRTVSGTQVTITSATQEIIVANNTQYIDRAVSAIYSNYATALTTDFQVVGWNTGSLYTIDSFTTQNANEIVIKLTTTPAENVTVRITADNSIAWWNLTPNIDEITINRSLQSIHQNPETVEVNSAVNVALDRIFKSAVDVIGMSNEDTTDMNYATNFLLVDNDKIKTALEKFDANITNKYKTIKNETASTIPQYTVVKLNGVESVDYKYVKITPITSVTDEAFGVVMTDLTTGSIDKILQEGILRIDNFNTSGSSIGAKVYSDATGQLTLTQTAIEVGRVLTLDLSGYVLFTIGSGSGGIGTKQYTNNYLLTDNETVTESLDKLDSALNYDYAIGHNNTGSTILANKVVKITGQNSGRATIGLISSYTDEIYGLVEANILDGAYGRIIKSGIITTTLDTTLIPINTFVYIDNTGTLTLTETPLIIGQTVSQEVSGKVHVDIFNYLYEEFYLEEMAYDAFEDITKSAGVSVYVITQDSNCTTPVAITDGAVIINDLDYLSITDADGKLIYKQGTILPIASNVVKVTGYNPTTREITLNAEPKTNFRVNFKVKYNRKNVPEGKIINASNYVNVINSESVNQANEIEYDNSASLLASTDLQNATDELTNLTKYNSFGVEVLPTLTKELDGTVTIGNDGTMVFNTLANGTGLKKRFANVAGTNLTIPDNTTSYIYCDYNNGTPIYAFTTSPTIFLTEARYSPIVRVTRENSSILHFAEYDQYAVELSNKALYKDIALHGFERQTGLILSTSATRIVTLSAGFAWFGVQSFSLPQIVSGTSGSVYEYYLTAGVWSRSLVTSYDASYYSNGTDRLALNNNKWVSKYFFRDVGSDVELYYVHGNEYNSQAEALAEALPTAPATLTSHSLYVGKIVIQKDATNGTAYPRAWDTAIQSASVTEHNNLAGIQGGNIGEYYHLTATQSTAIAGLTTPIQPLFLDEGFNGIPDNEKSKWGLSYNAGTRVFTLTITGSNTYYYVNGIRFTLAVGTYNFTAHANTTGIYYFYFNSSGAQVSTNVAWDMLTTCPIAYVYYNATTVAGQIGYELHGCNMSSWSHLYHHMTDGTKFGSGGALGGYTIQSDVLANVQFGMDSATYYDEDIQLISDTLVDGSNYNIITRNASGEWAWTTSTTPYLNTIGTTNNPIINLNGTSLSEITNNDTYFNYYVVLTNWVGVGNKVFLISGQSSYTTLTNAQAESITNLNLGGLPFQEFVILWQITYRYRGTYSTTTAKTRIEAQPVRVTTNRASLAGFTGSHNALSGRADLNSHPISAINATIPNAIIFEKSDGTGLGESSDFTWNDSTKALTINGDLLLTKTVQIGNNLLTVSVSKTLALTDNGYMQQCTNSSSINITVPLNSSVPFPTGTEIPIVQYGTGDVVIVATGGVTIRSLSGNLKIAGQYAGATLKKISTDEWLLVGNLKA